MKNEMRRELRWGLLCYALPLFLNQLFHVPELFMGLFLGLAICLETVGILPERAYNRIKSFKRCLKHKIFRKHR